MPRRDPAPGTAATQDRDDVADSVSGLEGARRQGIVDEPVRGSMTGEAITNDSTRLPEPTDGDDLTPGAKARRRQGRVLDFVHDVFMEFLDLLLFWRR